MLPTSLSIAIPEVLTSVSISRVGDMNIMFPGLNDPTATLDLNLAYLSNGARSIYLCGITCLPAG